MIHVQYIAFFIGEFVSPKGFVLGDFFYHQLTKICFDVV